MSGKVIFLLPNRGNVPVGGYKVVYEYANRILMDGYAVEIHYPAISSIERLSLYKKIRRVAKYLKIQCSKRYSCKSWFSLNDAIKEKWVLELHSKYFHPQDIIIATAAETALFLMTDTRVQKENKYYLIQNYENWIGSEKLLLDTWKSDLGKIVIAPWLRDIATGLNVQAKLIENGFDFTYFSLTTPIPSRSPYVVSMLYHTSELKGCVHAFDALAIVKKKYPELRCLAFGVPARNSQIPEWVEYYRKPDQATHNMIYNTSSIFVAPALVEGFALTPPEAMQCGCAVVATDIGGYAVACIEGKTALTCHPADSKSLAEKIIKLIEDDRLRNAIASNGNLHIQQFTWDAAYAKFKEFVLNESNK